MLLNFTTSEKIWVTFFGLVFLFLLISTCNQACDSLYFNELSQTKKSRDDLAKDFKIYKTESGKQYAEQKVRLISYQHALDSMYLIEKDLKEKNLKLVEAKFSVKEKIVIKEVQVPFTTEPTIKEDSTGTFVRVPQPIIKSDKWFLISGNFEKDGLNIDSLTIFGEPTFTLGRRYSKNWLTRAFGKTTPVVIYENSNPYAQVQRMESVVIDYKPKWFERKVFWFGLGAAGATTTIAFLFLK